MNQKYIIRTEKAGVFYAEIEDRRGSEADLKNARRIWRWVGATECIGIAVNGVGSGSSVTVQIPSMTVIGVIEIIPCSDKAMKAIDGVTAWVV